MRGAPDAWPLDLPREGGWSIRSSEHTRPRVPEDHAGQRYTALLHKTQVSLVPGFNIRPRPRMSVRVGVEVPVTTAKAFDYRFLSALVVEF